MKCPNCKNPVQANLGECEWCGSQIIIPSDNNVFKTITFWEKLEDNINSKLITCYKCRKQGSISCYGIFKCTCNAEVYFGKYKTTCPHCEIIIMLPPNIYQNNKIKYIICGGCKNQIPNLNYKKTRWF